MAEKLNPDENLLQLSYPNKIIHLRQIVKQNLVFLVGKKPETFSLSAPGFMHTVSD
jgi:hypothetical protein